ncbi:MAG: hypothetical protein LBI54_01595 [Lachnospiraceae bacterium]|jgi:hypothetical protein|nr:hypothetical protein [Lachnospiraceae bacterium]
MKITIAKTIIKTLLLVAVFVAALDVLSGYMNQGNVDMTAPMGPATYPLVYIMLGERQINCLRGYAEPMETSYLRETLTPLGEGRSLTFRLDKFGNTIENLTFEVRSIDSTRLIESTEITEYTEDEDSIFAEIFIKDLIEAGQEYTFVLLVDTVMNHTLRFYTRVYMTGATYSEEKVGFCFQFHEKTFDKEAARDLTMYLEPNAEGDNTTHSRVTINSSFQQITWGSLKVTRISEPVLYIKEMALQTASFRMSYDVILDDNPLTRYAVEEYYRIRYTPDRVYLLDFERTMEQIFNGRPEDIGSRSINLGITSPQVPLQESDGGNVFAFEASNKLYSFIIPDRKLVRLFGFSDEENNDARTNYGGHRAKILNVDEAGNVVFMVCGYMNRGRHEGRVGIAVYFYSATVNTVEELVYVPYYKAPELLLAEMEQLMYLNRNNNLYLIMDNVVHVINLERRTVGTVVTEMQEGGFHISDSNKTLVWQDSLDIYGTRRLNLMNLQDENQSVINAGYNEFIMPLGFMEEDLIYGLAKGSDITKDNLGETIFPMYVLKIQNENGEVLMQHRGEGLYITDIAIVANQITLNRLQKDEEGRFEEAPATQITNKIIPVGTSNKVEVIPLEHYLRVVRIAIKQEIDAAQVVYLTPREVLFEGGRDLPVEDTEYDYNRYYVYSKNGIDGIFLSEGKAINTAFAASGVVINQLGEYVWYRGNLNSRKQIAGIEATLVPSYSSTLAVCLDAILHYEGITQSTQYLLLRGETAAYIIERSLPDIRVLDLTGCVVDSVLYYVNQDIPVLVLFEDGNAMLLIGFDEHNLILMDPAVGEIFKMGRNDAAALFEDNGNRFVSYIRVRD